MRLSVGITSDTAEFAVQYLTNGVSATLDGQAVLVGKPGWVERNASGVERLTLGTGEAVRADVGLGLFFQFNDGESANVLERVG